MTINYEVLLVNQAIKRMVPGGTLLADLIRETTPGFAFPCNGQGTCGKCLVKISGEITAPTALELERLDARELTAGWRLACQTRVKGPLQLEYALAARPGVSFAAELPDHLKIQPRWGRLDLKVKGRAWEQVAEILPKDLTPSLKALRELANLPESLETLSVEYLDHRIIAIAVPGSLAERYGVAVDVGTTTLAAYLVNLQTAAVIATAATFNPQISYGADVLSRISYAGQAEGLNRLNQVLLEAINSLITNLTKMATIDHDQILQVNLVGNTCLIHLFLKLNPTSLGRIPFEPVYRGLLQLNSIESGLRLNQEGLVILLPGIGGFVGSDITAGVLACEMGPTKRELLVDLGTNGEIVLSGHGRIVAASTAAGPAFEAAGIACGMLAEPGAVKDIIFTEGGFTLVTIADQPPLGICGTGLFRLITELRRREIIAANGSFSTQANDRHYDPLTKRYYFVKDGGTPIYLSQEDIRHFQLAKGAVRAGVELVLRELGLTAAELERIFIAGAFGSYLQAIDAIYLGLLPPVNPERVKTMGNTAGQGSVLSLVSTAALEDVNRLASMVEHLDLANNPEFTTIFTEALLLK